MNIVLTRAVTCVIQIRRVLKKKMKMSDNIHATDCGTCKTNARNLDRHMSSTFDGLRIRKSITAYPCCRQKYG
jgi:hypothetical protein